MKSEPFSGWCCSSVLWTNTENWWEKTQEEAKEQRANSKSKQRAHSNNNNNIQKIVTIFNKLPEETTTTRQQHRTNERCWWRKHKQTILCKQWKSIFLKNLHKTRQTNKPKEKKRKKGPKKLINLLCYCVFYSIPARNKVREEKWNLCKNLKQRVWKSRWVETVSVFSFCLQQNTTQFATGSRGRPVHNLLRAHTHTQALSIFR